MKKVIKIPLYHGQVEVRVVKEWDKVSKQFNLGDVEGWGAITFKGDDNFTYHVIFDECEVNMTTISHECVHLACHIFNDRNIYTDYIHDEPYAYLMGYLVGEMYKILKDRL